MSLCFFDISREILLYNTKNYFTNTEHHGACSQRIVAMCETSR